MMLATFILSERRDRQCEVKALKGTCVKPNCDIVGGEDDILVHSAQSLNMVSQNNSQECPS